MGSVGWMEIRSSHPLPRFGRGSVRGSGCASRRAVARFAARSPSTESFRRGVTHTARDPGFEARVRASFARQAAMATIGAEIAHLAPGEVDLRMPYRAELTQQHGFVHAGIIGTLADSACGYAAFTLMP